MSKWSKNPESLYFQTAVLAEPNDHKSGRMDGRTWEIPYRQFTCSW